MAEQEYNVRVGIKLADGAAAGLQRQLDGITGLKVPVGAETDDIVNDVNKALKNAKTNPIDVGVDADTSKFKKKISGLSNSFKGNKFKLISDPKSLGLDGVTKAALKAQKEITNISKIADDEFDAILYSAQRLKEISFEMTDIKKTKKELQELQNEFDETSQAISHWYNENAKFLSEKQKTQLDKAAGADVEQIKQSEVATKRLVNLYDKLLDAQKLLETAKFNGDIAEIEKQTQAVHRAEDAIDNYRDSLKKGLTLSKSFDIGTILEKNDAKLEAHRASLENTLADLRSQYTGENKVKFDNDFSKLETSASKLRDLRNEATNVESALEGVRNAVKELDAANETGNIDKITKALEKRNEALLKAKHAVSAQKSIETSDKQLTSLESSRQRLSNRIKRWADSNSAAARAYRKEIDELITRLKTCDNIELGKLRSQFDKLQTDAQLAGRNTMTFGDRLKEQARRYVSYFSIASLAFESVQALQAMFQNVLEVDTAMAGLRRVTDLTEAQYESMYDSMIASAKEYGAVLTDIINATADWSRAGVTNTEDALNLAEITTMYQKVADLDYKTASENLLTAYKGFEDKLMSPEMFGDDQVAAVGYIMDILNELDNEFAVTAAGIGEAMKRSASSLNIAGNSIEETAAMITGITEVTQDPEKAGNALKVLSMRLRGMKGELVDLGEETDENVENLSKMQGQVLNLTHGKVNIFDDAGQFRSTYDIMQGIAEVWDDLSSIEQADLIETIAGKHRANDVASLIQNWEHVEDATTSAANAQGSAEREYAKYLNTLQAHVDRLQTSWQALSMTTLDTGFLNSAIDVLTGFLDVLNALIDRFGVLPTLFTAASLGLSAFNKGVFTVSGLESGQSFGGFFNNLINRVGIAGNSLKDFKDIWDQIKLSMGERVMNGESQDSFLGNFIGGFSDFLNKDAAADAKELFKNFDDQLKTDLDFLNAAMENPGQNLDSLAESFGNVSDNARKFAKENELTVETLNSFSEAAIQAEAANQAQNKGLKDRRAQITKYNELSGEAQKAYVAGVAESSDSLGRYMQSLNGAKGSLGGYVGSLVKATAMSLGLQAATMAMNAALTMGISLLAGVAISWITSKINYYKNLAEEVSQLTSDFENQNQTLRRNKAGFDELADSYAKLSKGVNLDTGENISLSTDEYQEFISVRNQIAEQVPALLQGYDSEGNAILSVTGNVEELKNAYNELIAANNDTLLNKGNSVFEDFKHDAVGLSKTKDALEGFADILKETKNEDLGNVINELYPDEKIKDDHGYVTKYNADIQQVANALQEADFEKKFLESNQDFVARVSEENRESVLRVVKDNADAYEESAKEMQSLAEAWVGNAFLPIKDEFGNLKEGYGAYSGLSDTMQSIVQQTISGFDADFYNQFATVQDMYDHLNGIMHDFQTLGFEGQKKIENAFDLKKQFNDGEISFQEFENAYKEVRRTIMNLDEDSRKQIELQLGFDENGFFKDKTALEDNLNKILENVDIEGKDNIISEFINGLNGSELSFAASLDFSTVDWDSDNIQSELDQYLNLQIALSGIDLPNIDQELEGFDNVNTALKNAGSATGLLTEDIDLLNARYKHLDNFNPAELFNKTANGVKLNSKYVRELERDYAEMNQTAINDNLNTLLQERENILKKIADAQEKGNDVSGLNAQLEAINSQVEEVSLLSAQWEGATSSLKAYQDALEGAEEGDAYDANIEAIEKGKELYEGGLIGTEKFRAAAQLFSDQDMSGWSDSDVVSFWNNAMKSADRYFDGTKQGINNLLNDINAVDPSAAWKDENGVWQYNGNDMEVALKLTQNGHPISTEQLQALFGKANDWGGDFDIETNADVAKKKIDEANKSLAEYEAQSGQLPKLNLEVEGTEQIDAELATYQDKLSQIENNSELSVEVKDAAIQRLNGELDYLIAQKQQASESTSLHIDASSVSAELIPAYNAIQQYKADAEALNNLEIKQSLGIEVSTEEMEAAKGKVDESAQAIQDALGGLDTEKQISLGFDDTSIQGITATMDSLLNFGGNGQSTVTLNFTANATDVNTEAAEAAVQQELNNTEVFVNVDANVDLAKSKLTTLENQTVTVNIDANIDSAKAKISGLNNEQITITAVVSGDDKVSSLKSNINSIPQSKSCSISVNTPGTATVTTLKNAINELPSNKSVNISVSVTNSDSVTALKDAIASVQSNPVNVTASVYGTTETGDLNAQIDRVQDKSVTVSAAVIGTTAVNNLANAINAVRNKSVTITSTTVNKTVTEADGTAHLKGTAFAGGTAGRAFKQGNWSTKDSGTALMGELGQELVVRDGRFFTVGDNGAEFVNYKKGDIIFNAEQTKELFEKGKITHGSGRGKALAWGTAFAEGTAFSSGSWSDSVSSGGWSSSSSSSKSSSSKSSSNSNSSSSSSSSKANEEAEEFEETLDWIEIKLDRIQRAISRLDLKASSIFKSWSSRNSALVDEMSKVRQEINLQEQAYNRYIQQAAQVGLSENYASKVRDGTIDIETITDEDLKEKIDLYQQWFEKALDCKDATDQLNETLGELAKQKFDNVTSEFDNIIGQIEHEKNLLDEMISQSEERGWIVSTKYYDELIKNTEGRIDQLYAQRDAQQKALDDAVASGSVTKYSEAWYEMQSEINETVESIAKANTEILEFQNNIRDIGWEVFDLIQDRISRINDEAEFLIDLMDNKKLYEDNGEFTDEGMATMGLHGARYNAHMYQADDYGAQAAEVKKQMELDPFDKELEERYNDLIDKRNESILAAEGEKDAIRDMVEEGINLELDALQDLIDKYEERLDSAKDLYEYNKKIEEQTKEIADLEKQMAAYKGDDSEESKSKIQELKISLEEAKADLEETEYDQYITDQQKLLDNLYLEYETLLNMRLDNIDYLISDMILRINENSSSIKTTIETQATNVGAELSQNMKDIWNASGSGYGALKDVISMYSKDYSSVLNTTNSVLNSIKATVVDMMKALDKTAGTNYSGIYTPKPAPKPAPSPTPSASSTPSKPSTGTGSGAPEVGDQVTFVSGQYYNSSDGNSPIGSHNRGGKVYITKINNASWATHPYHISTGNRLGSGDLGWLKLDQISGYASGKKLVGNNEYAWTQERGSEMIVRPSDGAILTPLAKSDSVLNAAASKNIWDMANNPSDFIKDNLGFNSANAPIGSDSNVGYTQNFEKVIFSFPGVKNYEQMLASMQKDKNFESLIQAITVDQIVGKSKLTKGKSIR